MSSNKSLRRATAVVGLGVCLILSVRVRAADPAPASPGSARRAVPSAPQAEETRVRAAAGVARLAWQLVRASGPGNAIVSPVGVWEALAMTHAGARGETAAEIARVLGMPDDRATIANSSAVLRSCFAEAKGEKVRLDIANKMWLQKSQHVSKDFMALLQERYGVGPGFVDFVGDGEAARGEINAWVEDHTSRRIPELLRAGAVSPLTRVVLTNAIFMKAPWADAFEKHATRSAPFHLDRERRADLPLMQRSAELGAGRVGAGPTAATICEIPYVGGRLAMVVIVPETVDGLAAVLAGLDGTSIAGWRSAALRRRQVQIALPRWTARKPLSLAEPLGVMGMQRAFAAGVADFSGIDGTRELFVSAIVHEGFVEVTEEGTEAAGATAAVVGVRSAVVVPEPPLEVRADRPFAWAVVDRETDAVLFAGVVADPR